MIELMVNIDNREVAKLLKALPERYRQHAPMVVAEAGAELTRAHLSTVATTRHRSFSRHNYYADAARSVVSKTVPEGAEIAIPHVGFALRYEGGTVVPSGRISLITGRPIRKLAIPLKGSPAEGKTPGEFGELFVIKGRKRGTAFLAGKKSNGMIGLLFGLYDKTKHTADASILPTEGAYQAASEAAVNTLINEVTR